MVKVTCSLAPEPALTDPRIPASTPCPILIPSLTTHVHLFFSRSCGIAVELVLSEPGPARSRAIRRVLLCVQGICGSHRCAHACSCDRVRVRALLLWWDDPTTRVVVCRSDTHTHITWQVIQGSPGCVDQDGNPRVAGKRCFRCVCLAHS